MSKEGIRMNHTKALVLALAVAAVSACASGGSGATGEPTETGVQPRDTDGTRAASVHLVQAGLAEGDAARANYQEALTDALTAIEESPQNPKAYLVAGQAAVGLQDWVQADTMFSRAEELYPPYEEQLAAEREEGWVTAYNLGAEALSAGDTDLALEMFQGADRLYAERPEARIALGSLYTNQGDIEAAAEAFERALEILQRDPAEGLNEEQAAAWLESRRMATLNAAELMARTGDHARAAEILENYLEQHGAELDAATTRRVQTALAGFYAQAGEPEKAEAMYEEILGREDLTANEYFQAGIGFFNTGDFERAAESFRTAGELNPYSRDALLNLVQSLYSHASDLEDTEETPERNQQLQELHQEILDTANEVRDLDPLNRNLISFMLRSYRALADLSPEAGEAERLNQQTQTLFREYQNQPYELADVALSMQSDTEVGVTGTFTNLSATAGETVQIQFEIMDAQGQTLDSETFDVTVPDATESVTFTGTLSVPGGEFAGWRYRIVS